MELVEWRRSIAHDARFYKRATQRSMAQRVCDGDAGLESSTSQQERYELLAAYLGAVGEPRTNFGPWMATACLVAFVLTMVKEWRATLQLGVAVVGLEAGPRTELVVGADGGDDDDGTLSLLRISHARRGLMLTALAARSFIAAVLLWYGCCWLVNTIDLAELLLNAVALEFVTSVDELVFDALAPVRVKSRLESIRPLQVKTAGRKNVVGHVDLWSLGTLVFVVGFVLTICLTLLATQTDVLVRSRDAICGGDQDFVYTTDGAGIPAWGYPAGVDPTATRDVGFSGLAKDQDNSDFATRAIDAVLDQHGRAASCEPEDCYTLPDTAAGLRYLREDRPDCCLARLLEVPNVDSGEFSVLKKSTETISEAVAAWNPFATTWLLIARRTPLYSRVPWPTKRTGSYGGGSPACGGAPPATRAVPMSDIPCATRRRMRALSLVAPTSSPSAATCRRSASVRDNSALRHAVATILCRTSLSTYQRRAVASSAHAPVPISSGGGRCPART